MKFFLLGVGNLQRGSKPSFICGSNAGWCVVASVSFINWKIADNTCHNVVKLEINEMGKQDLSTWKH